MFRSDEKIYRAYIPNSSARWFSEFLNSQPDIDIWLSIRLNHDTVSNSQYKYFSEFRISNLSLLEQSRIDFERNKIKVQLIINDLSQKVERKKRSVKNVHMDSKVVGKYVSHEKVRF